MLKIIITFAIFFAPVWIVENESINCEYLYFSWQGTEYQNNVCASEYETIQRDTIKWQRELLEARWIY